MRLGYLISQYPAVNHTFVLREVVALRAAGLEVLTVSIRPSDRPRERLSAEEAQEDAGTFRVLDSGLGLGAAVQVRVFLRRPLRYLRALGFAWTLCGATPARLVRHTAYFLEAMIAGRHFERHGVRHVHTHFASTVALIMARVFPLRYSFTVHGPAEFNDVVGFHMAEKVAGAAFVATISRYASSQVMQASEPRHWSKLRVLPLGVDPQAFAARPPRVRADGAPFRLLFVGRLAAAKAQEVLIEAVCVLRNRGRSVELTLVGDGPTRARLEALVRERSLEAAVHLAGACNHDRIAGFYRDCDAFVLASFAEGVPVVLMEAMAMEVPCVSTWVAGIPELIDSGVDGLLVPPADPEALAGAIGRLIDEPQFARELGAAARRKVVSRYDLGRNAAELARLFHERLAASAAD